MFQLSSLNKIFNSEGETFLKKFKLTHKGDPIFAHKFVGSDSNVLLLGLDQFTIKNHFYISPQIWAWKESRIEKIKRDIDYLYVILPFPL